MNNTELHLLYIIFVHIGKRYVVAQNEEDLPADASGPQVKTIISTDCAIDHMHGYSTVTVYTKDTIQTFYGVRELLEVYI